MSTNQLEHPWTDARVRFDRVILPILEQHGKAIGKAASDGNRVAQDIIATYQMLYRSFDPLTLLILENKLSDYGLKPKSKF
jgi:hypothetical protein